MNKENTRHQENRVESNQYICISPLKELNFEYKRNKFIATIIVSNLLTRSVSFKIKTNAPKHYLVEPSHGDIPGKEQRFVKIVMTSKEELKERCHDRFMVIAHPTGLTPIENYLANQYMTAGNCVITPDRMQKLRLKVHFAVDQEISIENLQDSIFTVTPSRKSRVPLGELLQTQTVSTAETLKNKSEFSQLDRLHYIPRRSKLSLSDENSGSENKSKGNILQLDFSGIEAGSQEKLDTFGGHTLTTITPMFKNNNSHLEFPSIAHSHIKQDICTDRSCDYQSAESKSVVMSVECDSMFRHRIETLERKTRHQKKLLAQMLKERDEYTEEINKMKFIYPKEVNECLKVQKKCSIRKKRFQLWQLMMISVIFLIIGSVFFSKAH